MYPHKTYSSYIIFMRFLKVFFCHLTHSCFKSPGTTISFAVFMVETLERIPLVTQKSVFIVLSSLQLTAFIAGDFLLEKIFNIKSFEQSFT